MAVTPDLDGERASDEAAAWLIRLQERPDDQMVRTQFETWLAAAPAHRIAWTDVTEAFDLIGQAMPRSEPSGSAATQMIRRPRRRSNRTLAVAAIAAAACLLLMALPSVMLRLEADYATATGERREVRLLDGSVVDLAPQSAIEVAQGPDRRSVRLLAGQAFFQVTPDATRPFQVRAGDLRATALGTAFDVRLERDGAGVAVSEGRVRVEYGPSPPDASKVLEVNDWLRVNAAGSAQAGSAPVGEIGAWRRGRIVAHDRTIAEVVDELRPYFNGVIVLATRAVARRRVTGVYELSNPFEALRAVGRAHGDITVTRVLPWLLIVSGG
jgi:transmembrane sensor